MLLGENLCWSLLGPKRLKKKTSLRDGRIRRLAKFEMSAFESFFFVGDKFILIAQLILKIKFCVRLPTDTAPQFLLMQLRARSAGMARNRLSNRIDRIIAHQRRR